ncbi:hypothetical protein INT43_003836 [Umbelopsis isabellina]|uniref:Rab3 GTPase-activating protein catalytic subunit n=1 Tax=Mortierella isabellina TaxID=91625 RepID=A0A8H7PV39_MORIS|nr:hypothetical protein INT43_003836 [Umbelopsis isabellina]
MATHTRSQRESSTQSEELFEFVDYTSASNFERLANAIEEILSLWGLKHSDYAFTSAENVPAENGHGQSSEDNVRQESISIEGTNYNLIYHSQAKLIDDDYEPINAPFAKEALSSVITNHDDKGLNFHALHRWTTIPQFLVLEPTNQSFRSRLFASGKAIVDINQAKLLISACSIAFHNTGCRIPVFIRCGSSRHDLFIGYRLNGDANNNLTETNYNTMIVPSLPSTWSDLNIVRRIFRKKLDVDEYDNDIQSTAAFTYSLRNWFDEDWKTWNAEEDDDETDVGVDEGEEESTSDSSAIATSGELLDRSFQDPTPIRRKSHPKITLPLLDFGSYNDPLRSLNLTAVFPMTNLNTFLENQFSSDMDAVSAPIWLLATEFAPDTQQRAVLSTAIDDAITSWIKDPANRDYLAPYDDSNQNDDNNLRAPRDPRRLRNLLQPTRSSSELSMPGGLGGTKDNGANAAGASVSFVATEEVESVLHQLFEFNLGQEHSNKHHYSENFEPKSTSQVLLPTVRSLGFHVKQDQLIPHKSFLWNLLLQALNATSSTNKVQNTPFISFLKILWSEVMRQVRWLWEHNMTIPNVNVRSNEDFNEEQDMSDSVQTITPLQAQEKIGIDLRFNIRQQQIRKEKGEPVPTLTKPKDYHGLFDEVHTAQNGSNDSGSSTFHRFLERLVEGDDQPGLLAHSAGKLHNPIPEDSSWDESMEVEEDDEEFFDSIEEVNAAASTANKSSEQRSQMDESFVQLDKAPSLGSTPNTDNDVDITPDSEPQGRKTKMQNTMLCNADEPLWIPETQDLGFMTEDMVNQQAEVFESLGTSDEAAKIRAQLQSAHLISDMQAFKAANPKAVFNDFVRWHSPKDWVTEATEDGEAQLSTRMSESGNLWLELWKNAKPVPVSKQKPLFNIAMEGEKALHYLESMSVYEVFSFLLPTIALIAYDTLVSHPIALRVPYVTEKLAELARDITSYPWDELRQGQVSSDPIIASIREKEILICRANSLLRKLPRQVDLVDRLIRLFETQVMGDKEREATYTLFSSEGTWKLQMREY